MRINLRFLLIYMQSNILTKGYKIELNTIKVKNETLVIGYLFKYNTEDT